MNTEHYTIDGQHPEDVIRKIKAFINELQSVQEQYFNKLVADLRLTKNGEDWLFDYVYNTPSVWEESEEGYDGFEHYLQDFRQKYENLVSNPDPIYNPAVNLLSTDFAEYSPMMHMSSYEADLETTFPPYNSNEPISLGLDTISVTTSTNKN